MVFKTVFVLNKKYIGHLNYIGNIENFGKILKSLKC